MNSILLICIAFLIHFRNLLNYCNFLQETDDKTDFIHSVCKRISLFLAISENRKKYKIHSATAPKDAHRSRACKAALTTGPFAL